MNPRFLKLIEDKGWVPRVRPTYPDSPHMTTDYIKSFEIGVAGVIIQSPIAVTFSDLDKNEYPSRAIYRFVLPPEIRPSNANSRVVLKGMGKVVTMFDMVGYLTAIKYVAFGYKINHFNKSALQLLHKAIPLPT